MSRFLLVCLLLVCNLTLCGARNTAAAKRYAFSSAAAQLPNDILPESGVIIVTPNDQYAWRVGAGGKIEYSFDSSHTWELQKSGVTVDLIGGWAPSVKICWVFGKEGTILLTTDQGKHWKKIPCPLKEDVAGIFAQDAKRASIWSASHKQSFETNDGGATWAPNVNK